MSLVHRCEVPRFFVSLHLALAKLDPSYLIEALFINRSLQLCVEQAFLHFSLICSTDLFCPPALAFSESVISFLTFAFSAFVMTFVYFYLIMVMFFSTSSHKKTKSTLDEFSPRCLFSFEQTISDIFFTKNTIHWLSYLPTG